jgi:uncharacterized protein YecT (DUF1311 family)
MIRVAALAFALALGFAGCGYAQTDEEVASRLTPAVHACERMPENGGTVEQAICYREEATRQDQQLNALWSRVIDHLSPAERAPLRRSERRWIKDRDAECQQEAAGYINSTAAYMFNVCMANETVRRTIWLEKSR